MEKGRIENANGRLGRWLPRQIDVDKVSDQEIQDIVITANLTPRKCLGFKTPFQAILKELGKRLKSGLHRPVALGSRIQAPRAARHWWRGFARRARRAVPARILLSHTPPEKLVSGGLTAS